MHWQLLGVDLLRTKDVRTTHRLVADHIAGVRNIRGMANATCVLQLESNLAFECQHIIHSLQATGIRNWVALSEGQGGTIGWLTVRRGYSALAIAKPRLRIDAASLSSCADSRAERGHVLPCAATPLNLGRVTTHVTRPAQVVVTSSME